jgi:hypothetical protein
MVATLKKRNLHSLLQTMPLATPVSTSAQLSITLHIIKTVNKTQTDYAEKCDL